MNTRVNPRRNSRREKGGDRLKNNITVKPFLWVSALVLCIFILYRLWLAFDSAVMQKTSCGPCNSPLSLFSTQDELDSTLYILESPVENRLIGAWLVVTNHNLAETLVIYIPQGVYVADPNELFSAYIQFADLEYAGGLLNEGRAREYALWQTVNMTGFSIERYIWIGKDGLQNYAGLFGDISEFRVDGLREMYKEGSILSDSSLQINSFINRFSLWPIVLNPQLWKAYISTIDTNFSSFDYIFEAMSSKNRFNATDIIMIDLSQEKFLNTIVDSSGREIRTLNYVEFDKEIEKIFNLLRPRTVERELAKVEVYNGSGIAGLASRYARKVQNYGVKVVRYDNSPTEYERTHIFISNLDKYSSSYERVKEVVCDGCIIVEGRPEFITTGDIIVILGKDKEKELKWR